MSRRVSGVSGRLAGGSEYSASRTEVGSKKSRWVSKKPTLRKNGSRRSSRIACAAAGATSLAWCESQLDDVVVADVERVGGHVLLADQRARVARVAQRVDEVVVVVGEAVAAVRQTQHPVRVAVLAGQQRGAAAGADRRGGERLAEQQALVGEPLDVRRRDLVAVRLDVAPGVVRMQVDDVRTQSHVILSSMSGLIVCATQRSGSTLLCELLKATGVAGIPNEYFQHFKDSGLADQPRQYLAGVSDPAVLDAAAAARSGRARGRRSTSTPSGGRGRRPTGCSRPRSCGATRRTCGARLGGRSLEDVFGPLRYVQVVRRDKVAQAVSLWTAIQTQAWRSGDGAGGASRSTRSRRSSTSSAGSPRASAAGRSGCARREPDVVVYEDFARDPGADDRDPAPGVPAPAAPLKRAVRARGASSWAARFVAEAA